jgi:hypothetical protein
VEILVIIATSVSVFAFLFFVSASGRKKRKGELSEFVEPLGFDVLSNFDDETLGNFYPHLPSFGLKTNIRAVCVADSDSMRIIVMEYSFGKGVFKQYYLGINPSISAPQIVIKKRTPSTKSIWTASWGDVLFQVDFEDDLEFNNKFIVRGDPDQSRAFLNPTRRKSLCDATDLPDYFSVHLNSVFLAFPNRIDAATFEPYVDQCLAITRLMMD